MLDEEMMEQAMPSHDFGDGCIGEDNLGQLQLENRGNGALKVTGFRIEPDNGIFRVDSLPDPMGPSMGTEMKVYFIPLVPKEVYQATLILVNDGDQEEVRVALTGVGGIREIEVNPERVDFGVVNQHNREIRSIEIHNRGGDPLQISSVTWTSTSSDLRPEEGFFSSGTIPAKTSTVVRIIYDPSDLGGDSGTLTIESNDEDEPLIVVPVQGTANLAPLAILWGCKTTVNQLGCDAQTKLSTVAAGFQQYIGIDGRESYDPEGGMIEIVHLKVVERPQGSRAAVFQNQQDREEGNRLTGDLQVIPEGNYLVELVVRDERGLNSLPGQVRITPKDLQMVLNWDVETDVDLHLVRPGGRVGDYGNGRVGTSTGTDCSTFNREPNWGQEADEFDNPRLDIDDVSGTGPEKISLHRPEEGGAYQVFVHYCDSAGVTFATNAAIEVRVRGEAIATVPMMGGQRLEPGQLWKAADVYWEEASKSARVEPSTDVPTMRPDLCRN